MFFWSIEVPRGSTGLGGQINTLTQQVCVCGFNKGTFRKTPREVLWQHLTHQMLSVSFWHFGFTVPLWDDRLPEILPTWPFPPFQRSFLNPTMWPSINDSERSGNKPAEALELSCFSEWLNARGENMFFWCVKVILVIFLKVARITEPNSYQDNNGM